MKNLTLFLTTLFLPIVLMATDCIPDCECETDWTLEVRGAYYQPLSKKFRKVYSIHLLDYQVEAAKRVHPFLEVFGSVCWANKLGHTHRRYESIKFKDKTRIFILPVSIGLKFIYPILPCLDMYAGAGIAYSFLRIKNYCPNDYYYFGIYRSPFKKEISKHEAGGIFKIGFQYAMSDSTFFDVFVDYYLQRFHFSNRDTQHNRNVFRHHLDCSGFKYGIGLGVYF